MREKFLGIVIITLFLAESMFIFPTTNFSENQNYKESVMPEHEFTPDYMNKLLLNTPRAFTANHGQLENEEVRFYAQGGEVWFTDDGVWFELRECAEPRGLGSEVRTQEPQTHTLPHSHTPPLTNSQTPTQKYKRVILKQEFVGANVVRPVGRERCSWNSNYFYGNDSSKWCTNVPNYREIWYENLYDGIDLRYYMGKSGLKYDFIVYPGAVVDQIRLKYNCSEGLEIDGSGNLIVKTPIKDIIDGDLFIYQNYAGSQHTVNGRFVIHGDSEYGFEILQEYNRYEILVIDPNVTLDYSTYIGGNDLDEIWGGFHHISGCIAIDSMGNAFITGSTNSSDFPTTLGANDTSYNGGELDCFVLKLNNNGSELIYSTYIGGNDWDTGTDIAVDSSGNAFITGWTMTDNFPTTQGAFDNSSNATNNTIAVFVTKLNWNGSMLIYSTFVRGTISEMGWGIAIDPGGNAYVTGVTLSPDFPITPGANDTYWDSREVFVFKLNPTGSALIYSTFIGGSDNEWGSDIEVDSDGYAYITGGTFSSDFPTTLGAYDTSYNGGSFDCFIALLNQNGSIIIYSTFIGGNRDEASGGLALDTKGNVFITGRTESNNFPTTTNAYDRTLNGSYDAFVCKLRMNGSGISDLTYSTYIGGDGNELGYDLVVDLPGNVFVTGKTDSANFPITLDAVDKFINGTEGFLFKLNPNKSDLIYSTYLGGNGYETGTGIAINLTGRIYIAGHTRSLDFPTTPGAFDTTLNGDLDVFVSKFCFRQYFNISSLLLLNETQVTNQTYSRLSPYTFRVNILDTAALTALREVHLTLDPLGLNIQLSWERTSNQFLKKFDPYNFITLESSSKGTNNAMDRWNIDFDVSFNWTYPDENFHDVQAYAISAKLTQAWFNATDLYRVENDLIFNGTLSVKDEDNRTIINSGLARGGGTLNWTGLTPVYEGTTEVYPPADELDITLWDETGIYLVDSPLTGEPFYFNTITPDKSKPSYNYSINLTSIPPECDKTNQTFTIGIDGDNISFSNPIPDNNVWNRQSDVRTGITITDFGGGVVDGSSVGYCLSNDNGTTWSDWKEVKNLGSKRKIAIEKFIIYEDGNDNFIKWCANDSVGNGPTESDSYRILVDTENVIFSNPFPLETEESTFEKVHVGITISDNTSGVNASTIMYSTSKSSGKSWTYWKSVKGFTNNQVINISLNLTFPTGTTNRIKWRAYDIAGNGPTESEAYVINVNTSLQELLPQVELINPRNGSIISKTSVQLSWKLINQNFEGVTYEVYFDTFPSDRPNITEVSQASFQINNLVNGETYYWTVVPKFGEVVGFCRSGIWQFSVNTSVPVPRVTLVRPENGSILRSPMPTFVWSVEYEGSEIITYDVYLAPEIDPELMVLGHAEPYYLPESMLEENLTYYWKIVPWAGNIQGPISETWSFTIKKDYIPHFELELFVSPPIVELLPGDIRRVRAIVRNLGELEDSILLRVEVPPDLGVGAMVDEPSITNAVPNGTADFYITVTTSMDPQMDEINLTVIASSRRAAEYEITVEEKAELTVKILSQEKKDEDNPRSSLSELLIIFLIIILILIVLIIVWMVLRQKKSSQETKEESTAEDALTVKPGTVPKAVISVGQAPQTETQPQLPEATGDIESGQQTQAIAKVPTLASSTAPGQVPETQQIPSTAEVPQLPPVEPEKPPIDQEAQDSSASANFDAIKESSVQESQISTKEQPPQTLQKPTNTENIDKE